MAPIEVILSLDPLLIRQVDAYVKAHPDADRSKVVDQALRLWSVAQQDAAMEHQFADGRTGAGEEEAWRRFRRRAASRRLRRA